MTPYVDPIDRPVDLVLGSEGLMVPEVSTSNGYASTPNAVRLLYQTEDETLTAAAIDESPASPTSTVNRGYEVTLVETVDELAGDDRATRLAKLQNMAEQRLLEATSTVERVLGKCQIMPNLQPNAGVEIDYSVRWRGNITNVKIGLTPSMQCDFEARRFVRPSINTTKEASCL